MAFALAEMVETYHDTEIGTLAAKVSGKGNGTPDTAALTGGDPSFVFRRHLRHVRS